MPDVIKLISVEDFSDPSSKGFQILIADKTISFFVVHVNGIISAYLNQCPHTGAPLDWQPDIFLNASEEKIQCATHGALFNIDSGLCEWGPCQGDSLKKLPTEIKNGDLYLLTEELET